MAKRTKTLASMSIETLIKLRDEIGTALSSRAGEMQQQLTRLGRWGAAKAGTNVGDGRRRSTLKGRKVAPKYRGPGGVTWAGRGARPRWLAAAIKGGQKLEDFLITKGAGKQGGKAGKTGRRRREAKR